MKLTPREQADHLWKVHHYYWKDEDLESKQRITIHIQDMVRVYGDLDYWNEVKKYIYEK